MISRADLATIAETHGLSVVGVTTGEPFSELESYVVDHVERGYLAGMSWFTPDRARQSTNPRVLHADARSIISVAVPFWSGHITPPDDGVLRGQIARYAWGRDYHTTLKRRMRGLVVALEAELGRELDSRCLVDTARIFDRAVAARAGTGWFGKNSMIIIPRHGSWAMLGEIIVDIDLPVDIPLAWNCGRCTICIDRCPTGAIVEPYRIDSNRCISYLTIEERGAVPHGLRHKTGSHVFGCDVCQTVCPYTGAASVIEDPDFMPASVENAFPSLEFLATMSESEFRAVYSGTPVTRAKRAGMARNSAMALGNSGDDRAVPLLTRMMRHHDEPLARGHAAFALKQLIGTDAHRELNSARQAEHNAYVLSEIDYSLAS